MIYIGKGYNMPVLKSWKLNCSLATAAINKRASNVLESRMSALLTWICELCDIYEGKCRKRGITIVMNQVPAIYNERQKLLVRHKMTLPLVDDSHLQNRSCVIFTMHIWKNWKLFVEKWQPIWLLNGMTTNHWDGLKRLRFLEALAGWWEPMWSRERPILLYRLIVITWQR